MPRSRPRSPFQSRADRNAFVAALHAAVVDAVQAVQQQQATPADIFSAYSLSHLTLPPQQ
jgi:hypothetical protein